MKRTMNWLALILLASLITGSFVPALAGDPPAHVHAWGGWQRDNTVAWSCTAGGREVNVCGAENCPDPYDYRNVPGSGHTWGEWSVIRLAACTQGGERAHACTVCGAVETQQTPDLGGHAWGGWTVQTVAGCTQTGTSKRLCTRCGLAEYQSIAVLGHDWAHSVTAPSCTNVGVEEDVCSRCDQRKNTVVTAALGHDWGTFTETLAPTCTQAGSEESTCSRCALKWTRAVPALGHDWGVFGTTQEADCTHPGIQVRTCSRCAQEQTRVFAALGHSWGPYEVATPASCTEKGLAVSACLRCAVQKTKDLPIIGHIYGEWADSVAATCTGRGTQTRACTMCGRQQTRRTKALGHVSDDIWIIAREPSLIQRGLQATTCTVCGQQAKTRTFVPRGYRYDIPAQAFGPWAGQVSGTLASVRERLIPVDMTADSVHSFPLVTEDGYTIGRAVITVASGSLRVSLEKASEPTQLRLKTFRLYHSPEDALNPRLAGDTLPFDLPVKAQGDLVLVSIGLSANYYQGNENKAFHDSMVSPDGVNSYADLALQMAGEIMSGWAVQ